MLRSTKDHNGGAVPGTSTGPARTQHWEDRGGGGRARTQPHAAASPLVLPDVALAVSALSGCRTLTCSKKCHSNEHNFVSDRSHNTGGKPADPSHLVS